MEIIRAAWESRRALPYAWRILNTGVCDGCALGTSGMRDWTIDGIHLCNVRLRMLSLNTMGAIDAQKLRDATSLRNRSGAELRSLGRLSEPMIRRNGDPGFRPVGWDAALELISGRIAACSPDRIAAYLTSRGMPNESYYVAQKAMRALGTNSIDNAARLCHAPSTFGLKEALGVGASTCSYTDWIGTDLIVFVGANPANNQPVAMKYLLEARRRGTRVVSVNPYREPGMERYWIPSSAESAVFGTKIVERWYPIDVGGDLAFLTGVLRAMIDGGFVDESFVSEHTNGFGELRTAVLGCSWEELEAGSGSSRADMEELARRVGEASTAVFVWSMGATQHVFGEDIVRSIVNLALTRGFVGRERCGLMPIRGHSGVQGGAEMGCYATSFPGGVPITAESAAALSRKWGFPLPAERGLLAPEMLDAAIRGELDVLLSAGGNFLEVIPSPGWVTRALERIPLRVHIDLVLSPQMLVDPADAVVLLPAQTRYEIPGGVTETSTERRVIFSPEVPGPRIPEARGEWWIFGEIAARAKPELAGGLRFASTAAIRREIASVVSNYLGIDRLARRGDQFQWGGPRLCDGWRFETADGRAQFSAVVPAADAPTVRGDSAAAGALRLTTRRGKQFNSMVHGQRDLVTGAPRDAVLISFADAERLRLAEGEPVKLRSDHGELRARVTLATVKPGNAVVYWPEGNVLLDSTLRSPDSGIIDYNTWVTVERINREDRDAERGRAQPAR
jgi:molybdopterin-dependent oxidoreductase alpha subunit